jgi:hypothetical protein
MSMRRVVQAKCVAAKRLSVHQFRPRIHRLRTEGGAWHDGFEAELCTTDTLFEQGDSTRIPIGTLFADNMHEGGGSNSEVMAPVLGELPKSLRTKLGSTVC